MSLCRWPGCLNGPARGGLCWKCLKREQRGQTEEEGEELRPFERLMDEVVELAELDADADKDSEFMPRYMRCRRAAEAWVRSLGWQPPKKGD